MINSSNYQSLFKIKIINLDFPIRISGYCRAIKQTSDGDSLTLDKNAKVLIGAIGYALDNESQENMRNKQLPIWKSNQTDIKKHIRQYE